MSLNTMRDALFVTYLGQNGFVVIFLPKIPKKLSHFRWNLFCNKDTFRIICLVDKTRITLACKSIFFQKLQRFILVSLTSCCVLYNLSKSKISSYLDETFQIY